ncbi:MAG: hypothetical protein ABMA64_06190 [Myxococcota bacterium]
MPEETLADLLITGPLPPEFAAPLCARLAFEVDRGHRRGLTHLSLTPDRIGIAPPLRPVLAPDDWIDGGDPESDLATLAATLRATIGWGEPVPPVLEWVVDRAQRDHRDRFRTAGELGRSLALWRPDPEPPDGRPGRWRRLVDPIRPALAAVGAVLVAIGAAQVGADLTDAPRYAVREVVIPRVPAVAPPVPLLVEGLTLTRAEAAALLGWLERATADEVRGAGISRAVADRIAGRAFPSVDALSLEPGVGPRTLEQLRDYSANQNQTQ